jgi:hypothetical protein
VAGAPAGRARLRWGKVKVLSVRGLCAQEHARMVEFPAAIADEEAHGPLEPPLHPPGERVDRLGAPAGDARGAHHLERQLEVFAETAHPDFRCFISAEVRAGSASV